MQLLRKECKHLSPRKLPALLSLALNLLPQDCSVTAPAPGITAPSKQDEGRRRKDKVKHEPFLANINMSHQSP